MTMAIAVVVLIGFARTFFLRTLFPEAQSFAALMIVVGTYRSLVAAHRPGGFIGVLSMVA